jgi:amidase
MLQERLRFIRTITADQIAAAENARERIRARLDTLLGDDAILILPSAAGVAPRIDAAVAEHEAVRARVIGITCIASLAGLPEVSLPLGRMATGPVGLSLVATRGGDAMLLDLVAAGIGELRQAATA